MRNRSRLFIVKKIRVCFSSQCLISPICFLMMGISLKKRALRLIIMDKISLEAKNKLTKKMACRLMKIGIMRLSKEEGLFIFSQRLNLKEDI